MSGARSTTARIARRAVSRASIPGWSAASAIAILLASGIALGALDQAESTPQHLVVGEQMRTPLYSVSVLDAQLADEIEDEFVSADDGETLLVVTVGMENLADYPIGVGGAVDRVQSRLVNVSEPLLALSGITATGNAHVWRTDGSAGSVVLQPRVPAEVQIVWPVPSDALAEGDVSVDVFDADETRGQVILSSDHITWRRAALVAQIRLELDETA